MKQNDNIIKKLHKKKKNLLILLKVNNSLSQETHITNI